jgi:hypothetical protein
MLKRAITWLLAGWLLIGCGRTSSPPAALAPTLPAVPSVAALPDTPSVVPREPGQPATPADGAAPPAITPQTTSTVAVAPTDRAPSPTSSAAVPQSTPAPATPPSHQPPRAPVTLVRPAPDRPESFLIYGPAAGTPAPSTAGTPDRYQQDVRAASTGHLAARQGLPPGDIAVVGGDALEVPSGAPCGQADKVSAAGLRMGYEVVLEAGATRHRYVAVGGIGYYCGEL